MQLWVKQYLSALAEVVFYQQLNRWRLFWEAVMYKKVGLIPANDTWSEASDPVVIVSQSHIGYLPIHLIDWDSAVPSKYGL